MVFLFVDTPNSGSFVFKVRACEGKKLDTFSMVMSLFSFFSGAVTRFSLHAMQYSSHCLKTQRFWPRGIPDFFFARTKKPGIPFFILSFDPYLGYHGILDPYHGIPWETMGYHREKSFSIPGTPPFSNHIHEPRFLIMEGTMNEIRKQSIIDSVSLLYIYVYIYIHMYIYICYI